MKTSKIILFILAVACTVVYFGCAKNDSNPPAKITPEVVPPANILCNGDGRTIFYPLDSADTWTFAYKYNDTVRSNRKPFVKITGYTTIGSYKYSVLTDSSGLLYPITKYFRQDTHNFNILSYDSVSMADFVEVPVNWPLDTTWNVPNNLTKKLTNINASVNTGSCLYGNLLEITVFNMAMDTIFQKLYYMKGLGLVDRQDPQHIPDEFYPSAVKIQ